MRVVGARDIDQIDILALDQLPPVGLARLIAPGAGKALDLRLVSRTHGLQHRLIRHVEEMPNLREGIGMGAAHEAIAHHADVELLLRHHATQPCLSRTLIMVARMPVHISGFIISSLGNMQPSQQMWRKALTRSPDSSLSHMPACFGISSLPLGSFTMQWRPVLS